MKFYHGTSIEGLEGIIHDGGFNSTVSNWLVSDGTRVYMSSVEQDYWDYSDEERQEYAEDFEDELREAFEMAIGNAQIAAAVVGSTYNSVVVLEFEIPDNIVMEYIVDDDSVENARGCYEITESDLNKLIIDGTIKVYTHQLLGAYKPYARVFYLPVRNRHFNESEVPEDVMKLACWSKTFILMIFSITKRTLRRLVLLLVTKIGSRKEVRQHDQSTYPCNSICSTVCCRYYCQCCI